MSYILKSEDSCEKCIYNVRFCINRSCLQCPLYIGKSVCKCALTPKNTPCMDFEDSEEENGKQL